MTGHVAVVGGGISGLAAAHRLRTLLGPATQITVLERTDRLGGVLRTVDLAGVPYDVGAEAFLARRPEVTGLLAELGLAAVHPTAAPASVRAAGRTVPLPGGTLLGVPTSAARLSGVLSAAGRAGAAAEPDLPLRWEPGGDVVLGALLRERFGDELADRLVDPLLGGVYAGRVDALGLRATLPALAAALDAGARSLTAAADAALAAPAPAAPVPVAPASRGETAPESRSDDTRVGVKCRASRGETAPESPSDDTRVGVTCRASRGDMPVFGALRGGCRVLLDALTAASGATVRLGTTVRALDRTTHGWRLTLGPATAPEALDVDAVLLAVPAPAAARLLAGVAATASRAAGQIELASSAVVALAYRAEDAVLPPTSGVLVAAGEPLSVKGVTHSSRKWGHLAPNTGDGLVRLRASLGRFGEAATLQVDDGELVRRARADLAVLSGITASPVAVHVQRWGGGLPQYAVGHVDRVRALEESLPPGLAVAGAALHGVGMPACVGTARRAAERVALGLAGPRRLRRSGVAAER